MRGNLRHLSLLSSTLSLVVAIGCPNAAFSSEKGTNQTTVMPVSASWGLDRGMSQHLQSDSSVRQIAVISPKLTRTPEISGDVVISHKRNVESETNRQIDEFADVVAVTAKRVSKESAKQLAQISHWLALFVKQQQAHPFTPITPGISSTYSPQAARTVAARTVSPKHPLWLLTDGRLKTVTAQ